jgi:hypothetical protein
VVEGSPPVPMVVRSLTIPIQGASPDRDPPRVAVYPPADWTRAHQDAVIKVFFSEPVTGVDSGTFTLTDAQGRAVPARVDPIGDGVWGLFPDPILLSTSARYTAQLAPGICDPAGNCTRAPTTWSFTTASDPDSGEGDTGIPAGFSAPLGRSPGPTPSRPPP